MLCLYVSVYAVSDDFTGACEIIFALYCTRILVELKERYTNRLQFNKILSCQCNRSFLDMSDGHNFSLALAHDGESLLANRVS